VVAGQCDGAAIQSHLAIEIGQQVRDDAVKPQERIHDLMAVGPVTVSELVE
jgi:hypothetical protein